MKYVRCLGCGVVWMEPPEGDYDLIGCQCRPGAEPTFEDLIPERGAYLLGVQHTEGLFDAMWSSPDWDGQVSMGFAATFAQEVYELRARALNDAGKTSVTEIDGPPAPAPRGTE
jgi:hypothetical protein